MRLRLPRAAVCAALLSRVCSLHPDDPLTACARPHLYRDVVACHLFDPAYNAGQVPASLSAILTGQPSGDTAVSPVGGAHEFIPTCAREEPASPQPILEASGLHKTFAVASRVPLGGSSTVKAVEPMDLALYPGKAVALVGESGSGKTTVARVLAGMYPATSGTIKYQGATIDLRHRVPKWYHHHVQLVFQDPFGSLNPVHTVRYHLARPLHIFGYVHNREQERQQILDLLRRVNLTPAEQFIEKFPHELSGGQRQRIAIARALAARPNGAAGRRAGLDARRLHTYWIC